MKSFYKEIISTINQGVAFNELILNEHGDPIDSTIFEVNHRYAAILGKTREEIVGKRILDFIPELSGNLLKTIGYSAQNGNSIHFEKYLMEKDKHFNIDVFPYGTNKFVVIVTDITEDIKKNREMSSLIEELTISEEELRSNYIELERAKNEKENALNFKNNFLAYMGHEIKTPLNGICSFAKLLSQTKMDTEQLQYIKMIHESSSHVMSMIDRLISDGNAVCKGDKQQSELNLKRFNIKDMFQRVIKEFIFICDYRKIIFNYNLDLHIPLTLLGDEVALNQILVEVLNNLIKYTNEGEISLNVNKIFQVNNKVTLQFELRDTGVKFQNELTEKILHPTSMEIIKMMNGIAWVEDNQENLGTSVFFIVELLLDTSAMSNINDIQFHTSEDIDNASKTILVVEENQINMKIVTEMIKRWDYNILNAATGKEALEMFCKRRPNLILLDMHMTGHNSFETAESIRHMGKSIGIHIPIIGTMPQPMPGSMELCNNSGMEDYIIKPFEIDKLERLIKKYL
ncbi:MAG: response regulator [Solirubrobacterales bacterium]